MQFLRNQQGRSAEPWPPETCDLLQFERELATDPKPSSIPNLERIDDKNIKHFLATRTFDIRKAQDLYEPLVPFWCRSIAAGVSALTTLNPLEVSHNARPAGELSPVA
jgi:hypothetical protein